MSCFKDRRQEVTHFEEELCKNNLEISRAREPFHETSKTHNGSGIKIHQKAKIVISKF